MSANLNTLLNSENTFKRETTLFMHFDAVKKFIPKY